MSPLIIIAFITGYFFLLVGISFLTGTSEDNESFFVGGKKAPWYLIAFGMIGSTLSGVTFISIPGWVATSQFSYMQVVLGYLVGYILIATVLLPLYYKLNLVSIYSYLGQRFGNYSYKTGATCFLISRLIGAAFRMYLVAMVFQMSVFDKMDLHIPFWLTAMITILLVWLYTFRGGIKTIIWTDTLQTIFLIVAVVSTIWIIASQMQLSFFDLVTQIKQSSYSQIFFFSDWHDKRYFAKQFLSGIFICLAMNGLDQDMMQKNLCCKNIKEAKRNMFTYSIVLTIVNFFFLALGALLYLFTTKNGIPLPEKSDQLFPMLALGGYLNGFAGICFILGLTAATYASADSALAALTTSFCVDILEVEKKSKEQQVKSRKLVHIGVSVALAAVIILFKALNNESVISELFTIAGYTYGPLLGLFAFGMFTTRKVNDRLVPIICILAPSICYYLKVNADSLLHGYKFGFELLILNAALTFLGLALIRKKSNSYLGRYGKFWLSKVPLATFSLAKYKGEESLSRKS